VIVHQLKATFSRPEADHLGKIRLTVAAYAALPLLAGHHQGLRGPAPWRTDLLANQRPHIFPLPGDVPVLLDALFEGTERLFAVAKNDTDDLRVAVFAAFGVTAIHPFDNANGRTALDFAQILLMHRWRLETAPFFFPADAHRRLGPLFAAADEPSTSPEPAALVALAAQLRARFLRTRLEDLATTPLERVVVAVSALRSVDSSPSELP
jgi:hypothetical protein